MDELITSVLDHYARLWPRTEELVTAHAAGAEGAEKGLVLESSALWPGRVAGLTVPRVAAVWLTAEPSVVRAGHNGTYISAVIVAGWQRRARRGKKLPAPVWVIPVGRVCGGRCGCCRRGWMRRSRASMRSDGSRD
ncbi:hypothetical protein GCM10010341_87250 [Streptomyces noursei]|nr:hypothetical protein GCM10010341_87250 [Streptomyces noursei]